MGSIGDFVGSLTDAQHDAFMRVVQDLQDSAAPDRLETIRQFLTTLIREIEAVNKKRDAMGQKVANIDVLLPVLDDTLHAGGDPALEMFRTFLVAWRFTLKEEIAQTRPAAKLEKKLDTERKLDLLASVQPLVAALTREADAAAKPRERAAPAHVSEVRDRVARR